MALTEPWRNKDAFTDAQGQNKSSRSAHFILTLIYSLVKTIRPKILILSMIYKQ